MRTFTLSIRNTSILSLITLLILTTCKKPGNDVTGADESGDRTAPSSVLDLTATEMTPTGVRLRWTATGDDQQVGTAATYDLRYWRHEISPANWDSTHVVTGLPAPGQSSTVDSMWITGLVEDSLYFFALKVADEAGNWSTLSNIVQAVCFDDYVVTFPDTAFEGVVRFYIGKPHGDLFRSDLLPVWRIATRNREVYDLTGIEHCRNLQSLELWGSKVSNLSSLSGLSLLRSLKIELSGLNDILGLAPLADLDTLHLVASQITDLTPLSGMNRLSELILAGNAISNTAPLAGKTTISHLDLSGNQIVFTNPMYNMTGLNRLRLTDNLIEDLLPLAYNLGLASGDTIWLEENPLSAATTDSLLAAIRDRGVTVIR